MRRADRARPIVTDRVAQFFVPCSFSTGRETGRHRLEVVFTTDGRVRAVHCECDSLDDDAHAVAVEFGDGVTCRQAADEIRGVLRNPTGFQRSEENVWSAKMPTVPQRLRWEVVDAVCGVPREIRHERHRERDALHAARIRECNIAFAALTVVACTASRVSRCRVHHDHDKNKTVLSAGGTHVATYVGHGRWDLADTERINDASSDAFDGASCCTVCPKHGTHERGMKSHTRSATHRRNFLDAMLDAALAVSQKLTHGTRRTDD